MSNECDVEKDYSRSVRNIELLALDEVLDRFTSEVEDFIDTLVTYFSGAEGFTTKEDRDLLNRIEKQLKKRFSVGSQISVQTIMNSFTQQVRPFVIDGQY